MNRTLEIMMEERKVLKEEVRTAFVSFEKASEKLEKLDKEITIYKLNNNIYYPMSELTKYKGKDIDDITLVERKEDGTLNTLVLYSDEIFEINEEGYLYYSSFNLGILQYDKKIGKYVKHYFGNKKEYNFIGFLKINLENNYDEEEGND